MRVLLTGGAGMLGRSFAAQWAKHRPSDELVAPVRSELDLSDQRATNELVRRIAPDAIVHAAAKVGGISAKLDHPTGYLLDNLVIDSSLLSAALSSGVQELLYIGSAAVYPEHAEQPIAESSVLTGPLELANEGYGLAKLAAGKVCEYASREYGYRYRVAAPSNLYGPGEDYSMPNAHLIAAALAKVHAAVHDGSASVTVWGDGSARREFTFVDDLTAWLVTQVGSLAEWPVVLNLGSGRDHTVAEYYRAACRVAGFSGSLVFDASKPSGTRQRLLDSSLARSLGWDPTTTIDIGMARSYAQLVADLERIER